MAYKFLKIGNSVREAWATLSDVISNIRGTGNTTLTDLHSDVSGVTNISNSIDSKIGTFTDSAETVAHKLDNLQFDKSDLAKVGTDSGATNTAISDKIGTPSDSGATTLFGKLSDVPTESYMKNLYAAHFEQNEDGTETYTMVMPITATIDETGHEIIITI